MGLLLTTVSTVTIIDLGERTYTHPLIDYDLTSEYDYQELRNSFDLGFELDLGSITLVNDGVDILNSTQLSLIQPEPNTDTGANGSGNLTKDPTAVMVTQLNGDAPNNWTPNGVDGNGDPQTWGKHIKLLIVEGIGDSDIKSIDRADFAVADGIDVLNDKSNNKKLKFKADDDGQQANRIGGKDDIDVERWSVGSFVRGYGNATKWCPRYFK